MPTHNIIIFLPLYPANVPVAQQGLLHFGCSKSLKTCKNTRATKAYLTARSNLCTSAFAGVLTEQTPCLTHAALCFMEALEALIENEKNSGIPSISSSGMKEMQKTSRCGNLNRNTEDRGRNEDEIY